MPEIIDSYGDVKIMRTEESPLLMYIVMPTKLTPDEEVIIRTPKKIFSDYEELVKQARPALVEGDWNRIGELMDKNQELLRQIGVSCDDVERIIKIGKDNGALGAKLTGTGRGGYVLALTPGKELQEKVAAAMAKAPRKNPRFIHKATKTPSPMPSPMPEPNAASLKTNLRSATFVRFSK